MPRLLRGAHELIAGIGNQRRAGVGDERDCGAVAEPLEELRPRRRGVVIVVGRERRDDGVAIEELARHPRILAGDQIGAGKRRERAQGDIAEIADRRRHDMQSGSDPAGGNGMAVDDVSRAAGSSRPGGFGSLRLHCRHPSAVPSRRHAALDSSSFSLG